MSKEGSVSGREGRRFRQSPATRDQIRRERKEVSKLVSKCVDRSSVTYWWGPGPEHRLRCHYWSV